MLLVQLEAAVETVQQWCAHKSAQHISEAVARAQVPAAVYSALKDIADASNSDDPEQCSAGIRALFAGLVEQWNDRLDRDGRSAYAAFFPHILWRSMHDADDFAALLKKFDIHHEGDLHRSYHARRARGAQPGSLPDLVHKVVILSRVTIGADVLLTSVCCQRLHQAFPGAEIIVLGDGKLAGLLEGLPQVRVEGLKYPRRGRLLDRLAAWPIVSNKIEALEPDLVVAPDSRLDQLGVLPVIEGEDRYLLWENTQPDDNDPQSLVRLLDTWLVQQLALTTTEAAMPRCAFNDVYAGVAQHSRALLAAQPSLALKFDHGGNPVKSMPRAAEVQLVQQAVANGWRIVLDRGFGEEECANSDALIAAAGISVLDIDEAGEKGVALERLTLDMVGTQHLRFHGSIAGWAAVLSACKGAVSYDSVGHHLAAALGVPLLSIFTGHGNATFPIAWGPQGAGSVQQVVVPTDEREQEQWWQRLVQALPACP